MTTTRSGSPSYPDNAAPRIIDLDTVLNLYHKYADALGAARDAQRLDEVVHQTSPNPMIYFTIR